MASSNVTGTNSILHGPDHMSKLQFCSPVPSAKPSTSSYVITATCDACFLGPPYHSQTCTLQRDAGILIFSTAMTTLNDNRLLFGKVVSNSSRLPPDFTFCTNSEIPTSVQFTPNFGVKLFTVSEPTVAVLPQFIANSTK